jgi:hypothetical protein
MLTLSSSNAKRLLKNKIIGEQFNGMAQPGKKNAIKLLYKKIKRREVKIPLTPTVGLEPTTTRLRALRSTN